MTNMASVIPTPDLKPNCPSEMLTMSLILWSMIRSPSFIVWLSSLIPLVAAVHVISLVFIDMCDGALPPFIWHLADLHDSIEYFCELTHTPITKVFECLSRYSIWSRALTVLHFVQLSFYFFTCDFMQRTFGQWFVSAVNMQSCLVEQVAVLFSPSTDVFLCAH